MTRMETAILAALGSDVIPADVLYREATGEEPWNARDVIRVHVSNIRRKLAEVGLSSALVTVRGQGYVWAPEGYTPPPKAPKPPTMQRENCAWCGETFEEPWGDGRPPFRYCAEHRHHKYRHRLWYRRGAA